MKTALVLVLVWLLAAPHAYGEMIRHATREVAVIARLKRALPNYADTVVNDPRFAIDRSLLVKKSGAHPHHPQKPDYDYVFSDWSKMRGPEFMRTNEKAFEYEEHRFGVPREFIVSILNIETQWGRTLGKRPVITTLYTLAVLRPNYQRPAWPEKQLIAFLTISRMNGWDPFMIKGSWTGAFGYPQFEPTSYPSFAVRCRDPGGAPDLFDEADAICSIGNYLHRAGWGASETARRTALHAYIHDPVYADAVLDYADLLAHRPARHRYHFTHSPTTQQAALK